MSAISSDANERRERNKKALAAALDSIEKNRKGDVRVRVVDNAGRPVSGASIRTNQASHAFRFGCYVKLDDLAPENSEGYEIGLSKLFNYAVVGTYWRFIEEERGKQNWTWFDRESSLARKYGMQVAAAPLLWGTNKYGTPKWLPQERGELRATVNKRISESLNRAGSKVDDWEIVNEPLSQKADLFAETLGDDYIESAFRMAREIDPEKRLIINDSGVFGSVAARQYNRVKYYSLLDKLLKRDVPIDVIGIQAHSKGEWFEPANVAEQLEQYARLGKPIQITEFSAQTHDLSSKARAMRILGMYRDGAWDDRRQAEFYREFYTVAFGVPEVEGIVAWGLDEERAWLPGIGLLGEGNRPKPAYLELDKLINHEWRTSAAGTTNSEGEFTFRGFYGGYDVDLISGGKPRRSRFVLEKNGSNVWTIRLGA